jgi:transcriptional regulator with XRE-family HTH domain
MPRNRPMGLEKARLRAKLTQAALAEIAGVARSTINKIEKGQAPRADTVLRLEQALTSRLMATGRIELVLPHKNTSLPPANGKSAAPSELAEGQSRDRVARHLDDGTWELAVDAFSWFESSADDERSNPLFWQSMREFAPPKKAGQLFRMPYLSVSALIHLTALSPNIAARLDDADETCVHSATPQGLLIACNTFESGPDAPSWGSITLIPWSTILAISNEHYLAAGARRYPRDEETPAAHEDTTP